MQPTTGADMNCQVVKLDMAIQICHEFAFDLLYISSGAKEQMVHGKILENLYQVQLYVN